MAATGEKAYSGAFISHNEHSPHNQQAREHVDALENTTAAIDVIELTTKSPYMEANFIGTYFAIAFGACGAFAGYVMPVTSLALINADIGPSLNSTWIALAWTLTVAVGYTLVGRLSDVFGRRWIFSASSAVATVGCIVGATAQSVNQLIGASVLIGCGAAGQLSFNYALGELVPVRHRFATNGFIFLMTFPFAGLGPYISRLFIVYTSSGWRGDYYLSIAINAISTICWIIWYHPPEFENLHKGRTKMQELRDIDYVGIFLFTGGSLLFLLGISWGGVMYIWSSAYVIGTLVSGAIALFAFVLYEIYIPLRRPLIPMHLFKNYNYVMVTIISTVGGMIYYSMNVIFPTMVATLFTTDIVKGGLISCAIGGGVCGGQFIGSWLAVPGGHLKHKLVLVTAGLLAFIGGLAGAGESQAIASALATCGAIMVGMLEVTVATIVTIVIDDQTEMGTAAGAFGSIRSAGGVLATAIYVAILTNRVTSETNTLVIPAILNTGLPPTSVEGLLTALSSGSSTAIEEVPGITADITLVAVAAMKQAYSEAFRMVFLASISFGGVAFIAACLFREMDDKLSHDVVRRLDARDAAADNNFTHGNKSDDLKENV